MVSLYSPKIPNIWPWVLCFAPVIVELQVLGQGLGVDFTSAWINNNNNNNKNDKNSHLNLQKEQY